MEIDWGPVIGGLGGASLTGILLVLGGIIAWRRRKNWDREKDRELAFKEWVRLFQRAIEAFCEAFDDYQSSRKGRPVLTELCFNFLHVHNLADTGSHEGFQDEMAEVNSSRSSDFKALRKAADDVFHEISLPRYWRAAIPLDSIEHSKREYAIAANDAVLVSVAQRIAEGTSRDSAKWEKFGEWLRKEVLKTKK